MSGLTTATEPMFRPSYFLDGEVLLALAVGVVGCAPLLPALRRRTEALAEKLTGARGGAFEGAWRIAHAAAVAAVFFASATQSAAGTYSPFIYFRF